MTKLFLFFFLAPSLLKVLPFGKDLGWASSCFSQTYINDNFSTGLQGWTFSQSGCTNESNLVWQGATDAATGGNAPPSANIFKTCTSCCGAGNCWYNGACKTNGTGNCTPPSGAICTNAVGSPCSYNLSKTVAFSPMAYQFTLTFKWRAGSNLNSSTVTNASLTVVNNDNSTNIASTTLVSGGTYDTGWLTYSNTLSVCGGVNSVTVRIGGWDSWTQTPWCKNLWLDDVVLTVTQTGTGMPVATAGANVSICPAQSTTLSASGGTSYVWTPSSGLSNPNISNPIATPAASTTYTVTVSNSCGSSTASTTVTLYPNPAPSISGNTTLCSGQSATLTASGGNSYSWIPSGQTSTSITVSPTTNTTYTVIATDANGCTNTATATAAVNSLPTPPSISGNSSLCNGQSATLTASGGNTYLWNTGATTTSISLVITSTSTFTVIAADANACTGAATFIVNVNPLPNVSIAGTTTLCSGSSTTLTASGGINYSWNTGATSSSIIISPSSTTNYIVVAADVNGCINTATVTATVISLPSITIGGTNLICNGSAATLSAAGGNNYSWNTGATSSSITTATAGTYSVIGTDANGCAATATATVVPTSPPIASVSGNSPLCAGQIISLTASGGNNYSWNTGQTTSSITAAATATATYSVLVSNGICTDDTSITIVVNPNPSGNIILPSDTINSGGNATLTASGGTSYSWSNGSSASTIIVSPAVTTTYSVIITDVNGCSDIESVTIYVEINCGEFFIPSAFSPNGDMKNDVLYVRNNCIKEMEFVIYNRWGQKVFQSTNPAIGWDGTIHGQAAQTAVFTYYLHAVFLNGNDETLKGTVTLLR